MTEREKLIELLNTVIFPREGTDSAEVVADFLLDNGVRLPVRCGECIHALSDTEYCKKTKNIYCEFDNMIVTNTHYCGYGKRRADNGT